MGGCPSPHGSCAKKEILGGHIAARKRNKTRNVHLGSSRKLSGEVALKKDRAMRAEALAG